MYRLRRFWDAKKPECIEATKKIDIQVSFKEFSFGIIILTTGIFITLVILLVEYLISERNHIVQTIKSRKLKKLRYLKNILNLK